MSIKLAEYERELAEVTAKVESIAAQIKMLSQEQFELSNVKNGWEAIIARERRQIDGARQLDGKLPFAEADMPEASEGAVAVQVADSMQLGDEEEEGENKTQFVRDLIAKRAALGTTPDDLKKAAKAVGMKHPQSWPYGPLQRLKKRGDVIKRKGKFYPKEGTVEKSNLALVG
jgi:hypothetical protein